MLFVQPRGLLALRVTFSCCIPPADDHSEAEASEAGCSLLGGLFAEEGSKAASGLAHPNHDEFHGSSPLWADDYHHQVNFLLIALVFAFTQ